MSNSPGSASPKVPARKRQLAAAALAVLLVLCASCETVGYYTQAVGGQLSLLSKRQPIEAFLQKETTDAALAERLIQVQRIRAFAEQSLALPVGKSYASYVDLGRDPEQNYVVWNVFAAPNLSLDGKSWCYPVIGCAKYRGYFSQKAAQRYADKLAEQGMDTFVGGVTAYSTLGWLSDPVLSSFVHFTDASLAALLFHELAHKVFYISGDTEFNESFATAVAEEGLKRWLQVDQRGEELRAYRNRRAQRDRLLEIIDRYRKSLTEVYADAGLSAELKLARKSELFTELQAAGSDITHPGARRRLQQLTNNASLVPWRSYHRWVPAFRALLEDNAGDLTSFYQHARNLSELPADQREEQLQKLTDRYSASVPELSDGR